MSIKKCNERCMCCRTNSKLHESTVSRNLSRMYVATSLASLFRCLSSLARACNNCTNDLFYDTANYQVPSNSYPSTLVKAKNPRDHESFIPPLSCSLALNFLARLTILNNNKTQQASTKIHFFNTKSTRYTLHTTFLLLTTHAQ